MTIQRSFSALQRAEIAEITPHSARRSRGISFSALQRAEIAEILTTFDVKPYVHSVSVLFNEPKLLKYNAVWKFKRVGSCFSALQRAEIAEIVTQNEHIHLHYQFQCSSTSRNC